MDMIGFLSPLIGLLFLGSIIAALILVIRRVREDAEPPAPGIGTTRRIFLYGLAFIALMLAATGITLLISSILDSLFTSRIGGSNTGQTAFGLAATIVGFPIWALLWRAGNKSLVTYPAEAGSLGRKFYSYLVLGVSAGVVVFTAIPTLGGLLGWQAEASSFAAPIVWSVLWLFQWRIETAEGQPTSVARSVRSLYVYVTSGYGLIVLALGTGFLLRGLLAEAYAAIFRNSIVGFHAGDLWSQDIRTSLAMLVVGGLYWWFHWHRTARGDHGSEFGVATVYVLGIFGGMVTTVSGASIAVFTLFKWAFDRNPGVSAVNHFDTIPAAIAVCVIGVAVWFYHRAIAEEDAIRDPGHAVSGRRVYRYLSSAVGLATMSVGIAVLLGVLIGFITADTSAMFGNQHWWGTPLAVAFTSLLVGAPLWGRQWVLRQLPLDRQDPTEHVTQSRRAYIFIVFGIAVLATLISGSIVLFQVIQDALNGNLRMETFDGVRYGFGVLLTAGIVSFYHWQVLREDRSFEEQVPQEEERRRLSLTAVGTGAARDVAEAIAEQAGAKVTFWARSDDAGVPELNSEQVSEIAQRVSNVRGNNVLITIDRDGVEVIPL